MKNPDTGLARLRSAVRFSRQGLASAYRTEAAFRQEVWLTMVLVPLALVVGDTWLERAALISTTVLLLIVELLNSAIESVVDRFGDEHHELSGRAKDMGSAAVLLTMVILTIVWLAVLAT